MERHVERRGESGNTYGVLVGKPEGKTPLGKNRRRREYNMKKDIKKLDGRARTRFIWLWMAEMVGSFKSGGGGKFLSYKMREIR
jgi:hypothetical protein